jgi:hypothetical protein
MTEVISRKSFTLKPLSPDLLISITDYIHSHKRVSISELMEEFSNKPSYLIKEALFLLEDPTFFEIEAKPAIKRDGDLIEAIEKDTDVALILHSYKEVYQHSVADYIPF